MNIDILDPRKLWTPDEILHALQVNEPPVDVFEISKKIGRITVSQDFDFDQMGLAGKINWSEDRTSAEVWVNPLDGDARKRFTLSHELGHLFKHMIPNQTDLSLDEAFTDNPVHLRDGRRNSKEQEANQFAAELLMPAKMVRDHAKKLADDHRDLETRKIKMSRDKFIETLAEKFEVSAQAMEFRLKNLRIL